LDNPLDLPLENGWRQCKVWIGQRVGMEEATSWLEDLRLTDLHSQRVILSGVPNSFFKMRITTRFRPLILEGLRMAFPEIAFAPELSLELRVGGEPVAPEAPAARASHAPPHPGNPTNGEDGSPPHGEYEAAKWDFTRFFSAPGNESALRFSQEVAAQPGMRFNPLLIVGATGLGKTHLLQAIGLEWSRRPQPIQALYRTGEEFKNDVLDAITRRRMPALREVYRSADALLLDGLEYLMISPKSQEELLHTFDAYQRAGNQLVFTAAGFPGEMPRMLPALRSRLEMGLIAEVAPVDEETRRKIVFARARTEGIFLPEEVALLLASRITGNLRQLDGAVIRLAAHASLYGLPITVDFAETYAQPYFDAHNENGGAALPPDLILERVADRFGLTVRALKERGRGAAVVNARRVAIHLLKTRGLCSYPHIGALLGNRAHSTIVEGHQYFLAEMERNPRLKGKLARIAEEFPT
jgi:chromosomal replication initiator protein